MFVAECRNRYVVCGLSEEKMSGFKKVDIEQVHLEGEGLIPLVARMARIEAGEIVEVFTSKLGEKNFLVVKHTNADRSDYEIEVCADFAKDFIDNFGVKKSVKTRYFCPCENFGSVVDVDFYRNLNLTVAQIEYDPYEYDPKYIDGYVKFLIKAIDDRSSVRSVTGNHMYDDKALATVLQSEDEM